MPKRQGRLLILYLHSFRTQFVCVPAPAGDRPARPAQPLALHIHLTPRPLGPCVFAGFRCHITRNSHFSACSVFHHTVLALRPQTCSKEEQYKRDRPHCERYKAEQDESPFRCELGDILQNHQRQGSSSDETCHGLSGDGTQCPRWFERVKSTVKLVHD